MKFLTILITSILILATSQTLQAHEDPSALVAKTSEQVRAILMKENGQNTTAIRSEVEDLLLPRFDFPRMTAYAIGKYWKSATPDQKTALTFEFQTLLSNTYFNTMLRYRDVGIKIKEDVLIESEGKQATVKSEVAVTTSPKPIAIDYVLYNTEQGWKVFNINVEGASLVTVYRNQFGDEITKNGIDGLVKMLHEKNAGASTTNSAKKG